MVQRREVQVAHVQVSEIHGATSKANFPGEKSTDLKDNRISARNLNTKEI